MDYLMTYLPSTFDLANLERERDRALRLNQFYEDFMSNILIRLYSGDTAGAIEALEQLFGVPPRPQPIKEKT